MIKISIKRKSFSWSQTSQLPTSCTNLPALTNQLHMSVSLLVKKTSFFTSGKSSPSSLSCSLEGLIPVSHPSSRPKECTMSSLFQNMLQVCRNSLPKTVSHSLAELTWVYSLGLFSQGSPCLARNTLYGKGKEMGRAKGSLDMQAEKSILCS